MANEYKRSPSGLQVIRHAIISLPQYSAGLGLTTLTVNVPLGINTPQDVCLKLSINPFNAVPAALPAGVAISNCRIVGADAVAVDFVNMTAGALDVLAADWLFTTVHNPSTEGV